MLEQEKIIAAREIIGQRFKEIRQEKGLAINAVALRAGLKNSQVKAVEEGNRSYTFDSLIRLCNALDIYSIEITKGKIE
jgi:transcriptional regulator with XRE-family HTH domain